ncbi:MAG: hypothetical protein HY873_13155 [Chloroflexi bacterium]|nr:hypothetical protein [Chloroflexota bacterium]
MMNYLIAVNVSWLEGVVPGIEAMADALPERSVRDCAWKKTYLSISEADEASDRTPPTRDRDRRHAFLLPYWCAEHNGFHLGHFDPLGKRAFQGWGAELYNQVNSYKRRHRRGYYRRRSQGRLNALPDDCPRCGREGVAPEHECAELGGSG